MHDGFAAAVAVINTSDLFALVLLSLTLSYMRVFIRGSKSRGDGARILKPDDFIGDWRRRQCATKLNSAYGRGSQKDPFRESVFHRSRVACRSQSWRPRPWWRRVQSGDARADRLKGGVGVHKSEMMLLLCVGVSQLRPTPACPTVTENTSTAVLPPRSLVSVSARFARHTVDIIIR